MSLTLSLFGDSQNRGGGDISTLTGPRAHMGKKSR